MMRQLLQQAACSCPPAEQQLGGISAGGWVALSLFIGMFLGSSATLLIQCWRRRRELRYMSKGSTVRQSLVMMHALPAPHTPVHSTQQPALPLSAAAAALPPPAPASSKANSVAGGAPNNKYFSPLNTNKGHGSVVAQLAEMRSSLHMGSDNGGDTHSVAASDQQAPRDKSVAFAAGQGAAPAMQRGREFSQHGMRLQQHSSPGGGTWGSAAQGSAAAAAATSVSQAMVLQGSVVYGAANEMGTQLPQEVSSSMLSAEGPLQAEDSSPMSTAHHAARTGGAAAPSSQRADGMAAAAAAHGPAGAAAATGTAPSPRQRAQLPGSPAKAAFSAARAAASSPPLPAAAVSPAAAAPAAAATVQAGAGATSPAGASSGSTKRAAASPTMTEIEDEYEENDLDDDWKALLGGVDARLRLQGARAMNARERAVAIKKLLVATGTRGVEFALNSTLQEVLNFRQLHGH